MIRERNLDWFPRMRAMSLAADDAEIEQNEMRAMQTQLDHTQKLLVQVAQQLNDVKEQVRCTSTVEGSKVRWKRVGSNPFMSQGELVTTVIKQGVIGLRQSSPVLPFAGNRKLRRSSLVNVPRFSPNPPQRLRNLPDRAALNAIVLNSHSPSRREELQKFVASYHGNRRQHWKAFLSSPKL